MCVSFAYKPWCLRNGTIVLSTSLRKTFFAWRFILNENILFWLTISYQKPFVFSVSVFCSRKIYLKIKFMAKYWSDLYNFYSKVIFWNFCTRKYFLLFLRFELLMFHNFVKISKNWTSRTLLKIASKLPTLQISAQFAFIFTTGKRENIWFFKKPMTRIKLFVHR